MKDANISGPLRADTAIVAADPPRTADAYLITPSSGSSESSLESSVSTIRVQVLSSLSWLPEIHWVHRVEPVIADDW